jgi:hypothetical protein
MVGRTPLGCIFSETVQRESILTVTRYPTGESAVPESQNEAWEGMLCRIRRNKVD